MQDSFSKLLFCLIFIAFFPLANATQADIDRELASYVEIFNSDNFLQQRRVMDRLIWAGIDSPELYNLLAEKLLGLTDAKDKLSRQQAAWYAKSLALSGNEEYRSTLEKVANEARHKKVRKSAELGLKRLAAYAAWNPIISRGLANAPEGRLEETRVKNMLAAVDYELLRIGAKRVYHGHKTDAELLAVAKQRLQTEYPKADNGNDEQVDAIAWLIKAMAESGDPSYRALLLQIAAESKVKKIRKYAEKYADYLG